MPIESQFGTFYSTVIVMFSLCISVYKILAVKLYPTHALDLYNMSRLNIHMQIESQNANCCVGNRHRLRDSRLTFEFPNGLDSNPFTYKRYVTIMRYDIGEYVVEWHFLWYSRRERRATRRRVPYEWRQICRNSLAFNMDAPWSNRASDSP